MPALIVLGASARAAAFSALRAGFEPYAIDLFADRDLAASGTAVKIKRYPHGFVAALAAAPLAPWLYCGGLENFPALVDQLATIRPLLGNAASAVRRARDARVLCSAAQAAECKFPRTRRGKLTFGQSVETAPQSRWLIKPRRSGGGLNIRLALAGQASVVPRGTDVQEFIAGEAASAVFLATRHEVHMLGTTRQLSGADFGLDRPFLYAGSVGPLSMRADERMKLLAVGEKVARRCGLTGLFNVDFIRTERELWTLEVNPRYSASVEVLEGALGLSAVSLHVAACRQDVVSQAAIPAAQRCAGKAIVYAPYNLTTTAALDDFVRNANQAHAQPQIADIPQVGEQFVCGQPLLTVLASAGALAAVESQLRSLVAAIHAQLNSDSDSPHLPPAL